MPALKPMTKVQFDECKLHWPTSFCFNKDLENKLNHSFFNKDDINLYSEMFLSAEKIEGNFF